MPLDELPGTATLRYPDVLQSARRPDHLPGASRHVETVRSSQPQRAAACPANAGLVGSKIDLPGGRDEFESATSLAPCVYRGVVDVSPEAWRFYKLAVPQGRTLSVVMRLRSNDADRTWIQLHGPKGESLGGHYAYGESALTTPPRRTRST